MKWKGTSLAKHSYWLYPERALRALARALWLRYNKLKFRLALKHVGEGTQFYPGVDITHNDRVTVGNACLFWNDVKINGELAAGYLAVGDAVQINAGVHLDISGGLTIADRVLISKGAVLYTHDHGLDPRSVPEPFPKQVGEGAWIGTRAIILPQCKRIGAGSIIAAGSVVTKDVADRTIVAGNPAKVTREI